MIAVDQEVQVTDISISIFYIYISNELSILHGELCLFLIRILLKEVLLKELNRKERKIFSIFSPHYYYQSKSIQDIVFLKMNY